MDEYTVEISFTYILNADNADDAAQRALALYNSIPDTPTIWVDGDQWN